MINEYSVRDREMMESYKRLILNEQSSLYSSFLEDSISKNRRGSFDNEKFLEAKLLSLKHQREEASSTQNRAMTNKENSILSFESEKSYNEHSHYRNQSKELDKSQVLHKEEALQQLTNSRKTNELSEEFKALLDSKYKAYVERMKCEQQSNTYYLNPIENNYQRAVSYNCSSLYNKDNSYAKYLREPLEKKRAESTKKCIQNEVKKCRTRCSSKGKQEVKRNTKQKKDKNLINKSAIISKPKHRRDHCECKKLIRILKQHIEACPKFASKLKSECFR